MRAEDGLEGSDQCMIKILNTTISTSSFAMYTFSAAVMVQAVTLVCFSSFADHGKSRLIPIRALRILVV